MENENISTSVQGTKRKNSDYNEMRSVMPKFANEEIDSDQNNQEKYDSLPEDALIRIIEYLPITQWPDLERVDQKFQQAVYGAWRTIRKIRLTDDFITNRIRDLNEILRLIMDKLLNRAPYLISISDFDLLSNDQCKINENVVQLLAQFRQLASLSIRNNAAITIGDWAKFLEQS